MNSQAFQFSPGVRLRTSARGQTLLLIPEGVVELNDTASAILELVDGRRSTHEIAAALEVVYDASHDEIENEVCGLCSDLQERGFLTI